MSKASPDFSLHSGASGGGQLGRTRDFLKEPDPQLAQGARARKVQDQVAAGEKLSKARFESTPDVFRTDKENNNYPAEGKAKSAVRSGDKSLKAVKPKG